MKKFALILTVLLGLLLVLAATWRPTVQVERSLIIDAPAALVGEQLEDFHQWAIWSPWAARDRAATSTYGGAAKGVGATWDWSGNDAVGAGAMRITEVVPGERVVVSIDFKRPEEAQAAATFTMLGVGDKTRLTWAVTQHNDFTRRFFALAMNNDFLIGRDLEAGLVGIKVLAEEAHEKRAAPPSPQTDGADAGPQPIEGGDAGVAAPAP